MDMFASDPNLLGADGSSHGKESADPAGGSTTESPSTAQPLDDLITVIDSRWSGMVTHQRQQPTRRLINKPWVLCIDDDRQWTESLQLRFSARGFEVVRACRGMDGYRYAFEFDPLAILLDMKMPGIDGGEVLQRLKSHKTTREIPIIVVTGLDTPGMKQKMLTAGAAEFLRKPVPHSLLIELVQYHGGQSRRAAS